MQDRGFTTSHCIIVLCSLTFRCSIFPHWLALLSVYSVICIWFLFSVLMISTIGFLCRCFAFHMKGNLGFVNSPALLLNKSSEKSDLDWLLRKERDLLMRSPWSFSNEKYELVDLLNKYRTSLLLMRKYQRQSLHHPLTKQTKVISRCPELAVLLHTTQMKMRKAVQWSVDLLS